MKDEDKKYYVELQDITTIQVDGNRTYLEVQAYAIINKEGKDICTEDEYITVVVPTLELVLLKSVYIILLILLLMYIGLTLYFEHRLDKSNKRYEQKNTCKAKKRSR